MKEADEKTVFGDFNNTAFTYFGVTSRFFKSNGKFFVHTEGPDGKMADFEIKYTFGVDPLQQYLVEFPDGRIQVLTLCWDSRPKEQGGSDGFILMRRIRSLSPMTMFFTGQVCTLPGTICMLNVT